MDFQLTAIITILSITCLSATKSYEEKIVKDITQTNPSVTFFRGLKVTETKSLCKQNICLTKCCPFGAEYNLTSKTCVNTTQAFDPPIYDNNFRRQSVNASDLFYFKIGFIKCKMFQIKMSALALIVNKKFHLGTDGELYIETPLGVSPLYLVKPENYCIDNFVDALNIRKIDALVCVVIDKEVVHNYALTGTCMLVSCIFILLTVGVYIWLPQLHTVHGRVLTTYLTCLFIGFLLMATMQLLLHFEKIVEKACQSMTIIIYYSLLSSFFWLNVMCYDIWRVFSGRRQMWLQKLVGWTQIRSYAIYAFGVPAILTILLISLEYSGLPHHPWLPMIRIQGCFLNNTSRLIYLYGPIVIICVANMTFFVLTAVKITMTQNETSILRSPESARHNHPNDKQTLILYIKLFVVTGINWILEVISALYPSKNWIYTDIYNVFIGLVIFIIFVCKRRIFRLLKEKYSEFRHYPASQSHMSLTATTRNKTAQQQNLLTRPSPLRNTGVRSTGLNVNLITRA